MPFGWDDAVALAGSAMQAGTGIFGGLLGQSGQQATNAQQMAMFQEQLQYNQQEAWNARIWNKEMAETQYQRTVTDMRKAGLNPILAANFGGAIPQGAQASAPSAPALGNPGSAMQAGVTSAGDALSKGALVKTALNQAEKDRSQVDLNKATEKLTDAGTSRTQQEEKTSKSAEELNRATTVNKAAEAMLMAANANSANAQARVNTRIAEDSERWGTSWLGQTLGGLVRILRSAPTEIPASARGLMNQLPTSPSSPAPGTPGARLRNFLSRPIGTPP